MNHEIDPAAPAFTLAYGVVVVMMLVWVISDILSRSKK